MASRNILEILLRAKKTGRGVDQAKGDLKDLDKQVDKSSKNAKKLGKGFNVAKAAIIAAAGAAVIAGGQFAAASIKAASAAEEMNAKFEVVFGGSAPAAAEELEAFGDEVNRSRFELMRMAASLQDTFVPMGFARSEAAQLSTELSKLAVDVGSFNDVAAADVARDFQSALVGNTETVRKYGAVLTETSTKAEAYRSGIAEVGEELTEQEKVQARLNLLYANTTDAQGDAIRTADSFANTTRGLEAAVNDLQVAIGQNLIRSIERAIPVMTDFVRTLEEGVSQGNELADAYEILDVQIVKTGGATRFFLNGQEKTRQEIIETAQRVRDAAAGYDEMRRSVLGLNEAGEEVAATNRDIVASLGELTEAQLAKESLDRLNQLYQQGKIDGSEYRQTFAEIATGIGGMTSEATFAQLDLMALNQQFAETGDLEAYLTEIGLLSDEIGGLPSKKTIDIEVTISGHTTDLEDKLGFQHGGSFTVGGSPGPDRNIVPLALTRGEEVTVTPSMNNQSVSRRDHGGGGGGAAIGTMHVTINNAEDEQAFVNRLSRTFRQRPRS